MNNNTKPSRGLSLPPLGYRIIKTSVAVSLCLLVEYLLGYRGATMPTESAITAIICMQPYVRDSRDYAISRMAGTLIGGTWGLVFLVILALLPGLNWNLPLAYAIMGLGVMASLYTSVLLKAPDASGLAAIVFLCVVVSFPEIDQPLVQSAQRIGGVLLGTVIAILVNVLHLPRQKRKGQLFFVRTADLAKDRLAHLHPAVLFKLNQLCSSGAKICLMSEHAPAFFTMQMTGARLTVPMIVMGGAALYDAGENRYLSAETIPAKDCERMREYLDRMGLSYFIYTIHRGKTCIFHSGEMTPEEQQIYDRMHSSPYRSYLEGEIYEEAEVVYLKVIGRDGAMHELLGKIQGYLHSRNLRGAVRAQDASGISGLYLYSELATMKNAQSRLLHLLRQQEPELRPVEVFARDGYASDHEALHLMHRLENLYAPVKLPFISPKN